MKLSDKMTVPIDSNGSSLAMGLLAWIIAGCNVLRLPWLDAYRSKTLNRSSPVGGCADASSYERTFES